MDVLKKLTMGLNLKTAVMSSDLLKLKKENLKPIENILQLAKIGENQEVSDEEAKEETERGQKGKKEQKHQNESKDYNTEEQPIELIPYSQFYNDEEAIKQYLKENEINVEYHNVPKTVVPLRHFGDIVDYVNILREKQEEVEMEEEKKEEKKEEEEKEKNQEKKKLKLELKETKKTKKGSVGEFSKMLQTIKSTLLFDSPRAIQKICIPSVLNGLNTICISQTGSGKTCAFLIPILIRLDELKKKEREETKNINPNGTTKGRGQRTGDMEHNEDMCTVRCLIVVPTTELAYQILEQAKLLFESYTELTVLQLQDMELKGDVDVCICTPAVLLFSLKKKKNLSLRKCRFVVFDEVDKLFEMTFFDQTHQILDDLKNKKVQKIFTTATLPGKVKKFISSLCFNHVTVYFGKSINTINNNVKQELLYVNSEEEKLLVLHNLLKNKEIMLPVLIFTNSIDKAKGVYTSIKQLFSYTDIITSEKTKEERLEIFKKLKEGTVWYLICTDIMSRGIDIQGIETVINYDICYDKYNYMHRIGRACRSNRKEGRAITMFTPENIKYMKSIVKLVKNNGVKLPEFLLKAKFLHNVRKEYAVTKERKHRGKKKNKGEKKRGKEKQGKEKQGKEKQGKEKQGKENQGKENQGKENQGKEKQREKIQGIKKQKEKKQEKKHKKVKKDGGINKKTKEDRKSIKDAKEKEKVNEKGNKRKSWKEKRREKDKRKQENKI